MHSSVKASPYYYAWSQLKNWRFIFALIITFSSTVLLIVWYVSSLQSQLVRSSAINNASLYSDALKEFRSLYTSEVVTAARQSGLEITHNYVGKKHAIPLPATLSILLGQRIGMHEDGAKVKLYSPYPFPWRKENQLFSDDYGLLAWQFLTESPQQPYYRFEKVGDREVFRYATADIMQPGCVSCHNTHPDSPRTNWKTGDVRGVLEIILPMDKAIEAANQNLQGISVLLTIIGILGALAIGFVIYKLRENSLNLTRLVDERTAELATARDQALDASRAKSLFLANMSHEIRTPMNAVLGYAQILDQDKQLTQAHHEALSCILKAGNHLMDIINDILDLSKIEANAIELNTSTFVLNDLLNNIAMMFKLRCKNKGLAWQLEFNGDKQTMVIGDEGKIRQVLINLIGNAVKFTEQGKVTLKVTYQDDGLTTFEVCDTGPGIADSSDHDIFDSFQQSTAGYNKGGTGLGLAIAKKQVEIMGGQLNYISTPNQLTRFFFTISLPKAISQHSSPITDKPIKHLKPGRTVSALVVDDVEDNRIVLIKLLSKIGVTTVQATNGLEALDQLQKKTVDIIFLDINMPVMNGIETLNHIQTSETLRSIKVVAISASSLQYNAAYYLDQGFHQYIAKPFHVSELYHCLSHLLGVEYEYDNSEPHSTTERPIESTAAVDFSTITLPPLLHNRLLTAAELYRISEIKACLEEVAALGEEKQALVTELNAYLSQYDMEGLIKLLQSIHHD